MKKILQSKLIRMVFLAACLVVLTACNSVNVTSSATTAATSADISDLQSPMTIDKTFDGKEINVNLIKFTGTAPSANSTVTINNVLATVNSDGTYYAYLDLLPGQNVIKAVTSSGTTEQISVTFVPPLVVILDPPTKSDYDNGWLTFHGVVSNQAANVSVDNSKATINSDGTFTARIQPKIGDGISDISTAKASLGNQTNTFKVPYLVYSDGSIGTVPGSEVWQSNLNNSLPEMGIFSSAVTLKAGQSTDVDISSQTGKVDTKAEGYSIDITRVDKLEGGSDLPMLPSLVVNIIPDKYTVYTGIEYHSKIHIESSSDLVPGDYYFVVSGFSDSNSQYDFSNYWLTIHVSQE